MPRNQLCSDGWHSTVIAGAAGRKISGPARHSMMLRNRTHSYFLGNGFPSASSSPRFTFLMIPGHHFLLHSDILPGNGKFLMGHNETLRISKCALMERGLWGVTDTITACVRPNHDCSLLGVIGICKLIKIGDLAAEREFLR